jgi:pyruvate kinase
MLLQAIKDIRQQQAFHDREIGILADLQGPKIRTGKTVGDEVVTLQKGAKVKITGEKIISSADTISIDYPRLAKEVNTGQLIMVNDGAIRLKVDRISNSGELFCTVVSGGSYSSHKGVNLPNVDLTIPSQPKNKSGPGLYPPAGYSVYFSFFCQKSNRSG